MDQDPGALQVSEKFVPKACAVCSALDETGDIRHDKALGVLEVHDTQDRLQGREMIVGDPGLCVAGHGQKGRFSDIGEADKTHIRDHLQFQQKLQGAGRLARLGIFGRLHGGCGIMHIAVSAAAALEDHIAAEVSGHIRNDLARICLTDDRALRHFDLNVLAALAGHALLLAVLAVLCGVFAHMAEIREGVEALVHNKDDITALAAVTAVRTACRDIFFPAERDMAVAALAAGNNNSGFIYKHVILSCRYW